MNSMWKLVRLFNHIEFPIVSCELTIWQKNFPFEFPCKLSVVGLGQKLNVFGFEIEFGLVVSGLKLEIYIAKISKLRKIFFFLSIGPPLGKNCSLAPGRGQGTGGVWGGPTPPRIRDLYSKNFENSQNIFFS